MFDTHHILIVLQLFLSLAADLSVIKQESSFCSDLSCNVHTNYRIRAELKKKQEEAATAPVLDYGSIPELLDCLVDNKPMPRVPSLSDEQQSIKSARSVSGTVMKKEIL